MATATIDNAAWAGAKATPCKALKVRPYTLARPGRAFLVPEIALLGLGALQAAMGRHTLGTLVLMLCCTLFFHVHSLDRSLVGSKSSRFWADFLESVSLGLLAAALLFRAFPNLVPRTGLALTAALLLGFLPAILKVFLPHLLTRGRCVEDILIVGTGDLAGKLYRALVSQVGRSRCRRPMMGNSEKLAERGLALDFEELGDLVVTRGISRVVVADLDALSRESLAAALLDSRLRGLQVCDAVDFYEEISGKIWLDALNPQWLIYTNGFSSSRLGSCLKRCLDVVFALLLVVLACPLALLVAVAIKVESAGPVLFRQVRVGLHGKKFVIYKFRSMRDDAELESGPAWATDGDARVTRVGRLLRIFRLDELPQAFNVLRGDMSIVGPRPERPCFVDRLKQQIPFYDLRHYQKPGITGWAQVMYRYGSSVEDSYEKLQYDLYYAKHRSIGCDIGILLRTIRIVLFGRGR